MSENQDMSHEETSGEELARMLTRRGKQGRAKSTTALLAILLVLVGVLLGVPLGRATSASDVQSGISEASPPRG